MMPLSKDTDNRESDKYCSYCYHGGKLVYEGTDVKEFQKFSYKSMVQKGMNPLKAKILVYFMKFAPRWKK